MPSLVAQRDYGLIGNRFANTIWRLPSPWWGADVPVTIHATAGGIVALQKTWNRLLYLQMDVARYLFDASKQGPKNDSARQKMLNK